MVMEDVNVRRSRVKSVFVNFSVNVKLFQDFFFLKHIHCQGSETTLYDIIVMDTCHYMHLPKPAKYTPQRVSLLTLVDNDASVFVH